MVLITRREVEKESAGVVALIISHSFRVLSIYEISTENSSHAEQFNLIKIISLLSTAMHAITAEIGAAKKYESNRKKKCST